MKGQCHDRFTENGNEWIDNSGSRIKFLRLRRLRVFTCRILVRQNVTVIRTPAIFDCNRHLEAKCRLKHATVYTT